MDDGSGRISVCACVNQHAALAIHMLLSTAPHIRSLRGALASAPRSYYSLLVGVDCGTQSTKVCVYRSDDGALVSRSTVAHDVASPADGFAESDARQWSAALRTAIRGALGDAASASASATADVSGTSTDDTPAPLPVAAVGISFQREGFTMVAPPVAREADEKDVNGEAAAEAGLPSAGAGGAGSGAGGAAEEAARRPSPLEPLRPAILWLDGRAHVEVEELLGDEDIGGCSFNEVSEAVML